MGSVSTSPSTDSVVSSLRRGMTFLSGWLARPRKVASAVPSSHVLERRLGSRVQELDPRVLIELGPGTGGTTRALLDHIRPDARLFAIEILPEFVDQLRHIEDPRLSVVRADAIDMMRILPQQEIDHADVIVSGIPFSTMPPSTARFLVSQIHQALAPGGHFIAYQFRDMISRYAIDSFGDPTVSYVPWNLPPLRLYQWQKASVSASRLDHEAGTRGDACCVG